MTATLTNEYLIDLASEISIARTEGALADTRRLLNLINVAVELAEKGARDSRTDAPLAKELHKQASALNDLSDQLCKALNEYGERRHPMEQIIAEMRSAVGAVS